ncbi:DUF1304 domain-containing protein [Pediococcus siamensis]|uniref:DUF1304 domain-containing protein n=1 Tax=Pediococcus siamensis TaxID=381829 RepID=UPI0039A19D0D
MTTLTLILTALIGIEHLGFMLIEMFAGPKTQARTFAMPYEFVSQPQARIALENQGLYNGALGLLIILSMVIFSGSTLLSLVRLYMLFVMIVGAYGGFTVTKKIYFVQLLPATLVLILSFF